MKQYYAYIRVSDPKQERGVSLAQQREDIERYAARQGVAIEKWFVDVETAAKTGRREFSKMLSLLRTKKSAGVIFHKIDRSMRNRTEWARLNDLFDRGIDVRFAHEGVDMHTRSGRVAADVQAALAVAYIANLRDEVIKGMWGRLKQGHYPWTAPPGYRNNGEGKLKTIDPVQGPLAVQAFELYAQGGYTLRTLAAEMKRRGMRHLYKNRQVPVTKNGIASMLRNPFYIGLIEVKKTGETFQGAHEPLLSRALFDRVQQALDKKSFRKIQRHNLVFRRMVPCPTCDRNLIGEIQKGHTYYRCHTKGCSVCLREEVLEEAVREKLEPLCLSPELRTYLAGRIEKHLDDPRHGKEATEAALRLELANIKKRLMALTDAFVDGTLEKELFDERKSQLLLERQQLEENLAAQEGGQERLLNQLQNYLELAGDALLSYTAASVDEKRQLLADLTSNWTVEGKHASVELRFPFQKIAASRLVLDCPQERAQPRKKARRTTMVADALVGPLIAWARARLHKENAA